MGFDDMLVVCTYLALIFAYGQSQFKWNSLNFSVMQFK